MTFESKRLHDITYGMYVIGTMDGTRPTGCIVNTVVQITSEGPVIAVSMNKDNYTHDLMVKNGRFSVSVLSENCNPSVIGKLGFSSGRDIDKFDGIDYSMEEGIPVIKKGSTSVFICEVLSTVDVKTHDIFLAKVVGTVAGDDFASPMTYSYYHRVIKGKAPKNAPTYQEPVSKDADEKEEPIANVENTTEGGNKTMKYVCTICGYVYEGDINLEPDDYVCPLCGAGKEMFELEEE